MKINSVFENKVTYIHLLGILTTNFVSQTTYNVDTIENKLISNVMRQMCDEFTAADFTANEYTYLFVAIAE